MDYQNLVIIENHGLSKQKALEELMLLSNNAIIYRRMLKISWKMRIKTY